MPNSCSKSFHFLPVFPLFSIDLSSQFLIFEPQFQPSNQSLIRISRRVKGVKRSIIETLMLEAIK